MNKSTKMIFIYHVYVLQQSYKIYFVKSLTVVLI